MLSMLFIRWTGCSHLMHLSCFYFSWVELIHIYFTSQQTNENTKYRRMPKKSSVHINRWTMLYFNTYSLKYLQWATWHLFLMRSDNYIIETILPYVWQTLLSMKIAASWPFSYTTDVIVSMEHTYGILFIHLPTAATSYILSRAICSGTSAERLLEAQGWVKSLSKLNLVIRFCIFHGHIYLSLQVSQPSSD